MKISMISEHASPLAALGGADAGGQNVHVAELSAALTGRGHEVTVYTRRDDPDSPETVEVPDGYRVAHVPAGPPHTVAKDDIYRYMGDFAAHLRKCWQQDRPDVVHAHFWMSGLAATRAADDAGIPVVQTFHALGAVKRRYQGTADTSPPERLAAESALAAKVARVIATCSDEVFELARIGMPRARATVVPCGVDVDRFGPTGPTFPSAGQKRIVTVGRLVPRKGFDVAIAALPRLPDVELLIAGGPEPDRLSTDEEANRLVEVARAHGVANRVRLLGRVSREDMPALLRSADAVACTPWYEPFGIVPLEAMACGRPVVAAAVGGLRDTVVDGATGLLVPPRDPAQLASALRMLLGSERGRAFGAAGRRRVCSRYTWDRVAADTVKVYQRLCAASDGAERSAGGT